MRTHHNNFNRFALSIIWLIAQGYELLSVREGDKKVKIRLKLKEKYMFKKISSFLTLTLLSCFSHAHETPGKYNNKFAASISQSSETVTITKCIALSISTDSIDADTAFTIGTMLIPQYLILEMKYNGSEINFSKGQVVNYVNYEAGFARSINYFHGRYSAIKQMINNKEVSDKYFIDIEEDLKCKENDAVQSVVKIAQ